MKLQSLLQVSRKTTITIANVKKFAEYILTDSNLTLVFSEKVSSFSSIMRVNQSQISLSLCICVLLVTGCLFLFSYKGFLSRGWLVFL